jgi:hypothetical protein
MRLFLRPLNRKVKPLKYLLGKKMLTIYESESESVWMYFLRWKEEKPHLDGLYHGLLLPRSQYMYLFKTSWLFLASSIYCYQMRHYDYIILPFGVWVTSINYWRKPDYSWRRYVDIFYAHFAVFYQALTAYGAQYQTPFYVIFCLAVISYLFGIYYKVKGYGNGNSWNSTLCHGNAHVLANVGCFVLYSGTMRSFWITF